ncbi:hypothetical protein [Serratia ureilytica]|uniref:hypothetical protein n=1 Tax=Serratia ureilytica TaxID=300181 RepID=UPI00313D7037
MKEELYGLANHIAGAKGGLPQDWQDWANEIEMDLRKLANWEAQPVALVDRRPAASGSICWQNGGKDLAHGTELFTAPPAPAVPEEAKVGEMPFLGKNERGYVRGWNDCRAAMLAQPVSSGYKLPPHLYRELVNSLRDTAVKFSGTEQLRERLNTALSKFIEPDHPHTRTVAPEGGNDHDTRR